MLETYDYKARDREGKVKIGVIEAETTQAVVTHLKSLGYLPVSVKTRRPGLLKRDLKIFSSKKVKLSEIAVFSRQFATMIESGITIMRALEVLETQMTSSVLVEALQDMRRRISTGESLSEAVNAHPKVFDRLFRAMIRAGETSGNLETVLMRSADTLEKRAELARKIKSALTYPIGVLILVVLILTAMLLFVVPTFKSIFASLGGKLPLPTQLLIDASHLAVEFFPLLFLFYGGIVYAFVRFKRTAKGKAMLDRLSLRIPIFGQLIRKYALARFAGTLATLMQSGVNVVPALEIAADVASLDPISVALADMRIGIAQGESLAFRMPNHSIFPPMVTQMVSIGEESGTVDVLLAKLAQFYEQEVNAMTAALSSLLEPLLVVVLGAVVGSMVVALYLPMIDVYKLVEKS